MSFTTKKIHGKLYDYFEYYLGKKRVSKSLTGIPTVEEKKRLALRVLNEKVEPFISKLNEKVGLVETCQYQSHTNRKEFREWFQKHLNTKKEFLEKMTEKTYNQVEDWLETKPRNLPIITLVETNKNGVQITDICVDCLYKKLDSYGYSAFGRTKKQPMNIGVLFLNTGGF